jgi:hypothetical protein
MLSVNKKFGIQFYYSFPKDFYQKIKQLEVPTHFNFSGEKFLNSLNVKNRKEIHVNLYHQQAEFFAIENKKVILYNNLDAASEVDFDFIMFTLSKIDFEFLKPISTSMVRQLKMRLYFRNAEICI